MNGDGRIWCGIATKYLCSHLYYGFYAKGGSVLETGFSSGEWSILTLLCLLRKHKDESQSYLFFLQSNYLTAVWSRIIKLCLIFRIPQRCRDETTVVVNLSPFLVEDLWQ